jgi:phosphomannomutase
MINPAIIREYDIRGIYNKTLTEKDAFLVGWSFAQALNKKSSTVTLCRDGRLSSPALHAALTEGLISGGTNVIDIGIGPTPMLYFSTFVNDVDAGIMVTGSHNPSEYNGFKFIVGKAPFFGDDIKKLREISATYSDSYVCKKGTLSKKIIVDEYLSVLVDVCKDTKPMKIAWDAGNGAAGEVVEKLCKKLPGEHILLNTKIDGTFPVHHPDPTIVENLQQLISVVVEKKCDLGIAFDGDGDRIGIIDDKGGVIWGDQLLSILAKDILTRIPGAPIIADVKASRVVFDLIKQYGGQPVMWKTGHSNIKQHMKDIGSPLAGEMSGHIFIADQYYGYDDALYAGLRLIKILSDSEKKVSSILGDLPTAYNTPELRIECDEDKKFLIISKLKEYFIKNKIPFDDIDGIRYSSNTGWGLIRASNTQSVLVCRFEASSRQEVEEQFFFMSKLLQQYDLVLSEEKLLVSCG